jgi:hypothetical protein
VGKQSADVAGDHYSLLAHRHSQMAWEVEAESSGRIDRPRGPQQPIVESRAMVGVVDFVALGRSQSTADVGQFDVQARFVARPIFSFVGTASWRVPSSWMR